MTSLQQILVPLLLLVSSAAWAGNDRGGGGEGVVCVDKKGQIASVHLLDFYEKGNDYRTSFPVGHQGVDAKVESVLQMVAIFDSIRADRYRNVLRHFYDQVEWVDTLSSTEDFGYVKLPSECRLAQLAQQQQDTQSLNASTPMKIKIVRDLWNRLSEDDKAGLVLHEIAYDELRRLGSRNSIQLRSFIAWLVHSTTEGIAAIDYDSALLEAGFQSSPSCNVQWKYVMSQQTACTWTHFSMDLAKSLENPCNVPVGFSLQLKYGHLQTLGMTGTKIDMATTGPGQAVVVVQAISGQGLATFHMVIDANYCTQ